MYNYLLLVSELSKTKKVKVIGLEGADRLGGRVYTKDKDELGAAWIHGEKRDAQIGDFLVEEVNPVFEMAESIGCKYVETAGMTAVSSDGKPLDCSQELWDQMWVVLDRIKTSPTSIENAFRASDDPESNVYSYIKANYSALFEGILLNHRFSVMKAVREWQSYYAGIWNKLAIGSLAVDKEFIGAQRIITDGGYKNLIDKYQKDIEANGGEIRLNQIVREIRYSKNGVEIHVQGSSVPIKADAVVVTVSLGVLKSNLIRFDPPLPENKQDSINKLGFGVYDKIFVEFDQAIEVENGGFWPKNSGSVLVVPYVNDDIYDTLSQIDIEEACRMSPYMSQSLSQASSPPDSPRPYHKRDRDHIGIEMVNLSGLGNNCHKLVMLIYDEVAMDVETFAHDKSKLIAYAQQKLDNAFHGKCVPRITNAYATTWGSNELTRGSFANIPVGASGQDMVNLSLPVEERLMFAGEATFPLHYSTVHGALKSGRREFQRIMELFFPE